MNYTQCFLLFLIFTCSNCKAIVNISKLTEAETIEFITGLRPCRKGGIRLEIENYNNQSIIHNYGHGGCGISFSWGSAEIALELFENELKNHPEWENQTIAIIGSGVIGLTTAHLLLDKGYNIEIYAKEFPPNTTSDIAPAIWSKILVEKALSNKQIELLNKIERLSYLNFDKLANSIQPRFQGVSYVDAYTFKGNLEKIKTRLLPELAKTCRDTEIQFKKQKKECVTFRTLLIETPIYMQDLYEQLKAKNIVFIDQHFSTKDALKKLPHSVIFNCTGLGSLDLFQDNDVFPVKGHLISLTPQENIDFVLAGPMGSDTIDMYIIPLKNKLILGGSYVINDLIKNSYDEMIFRQIMNHAYSFLED